MNEQEEQSNSEPNGQQPEAAADRELHLPQPTPPSYSPPPVSTPVSPDPQPPYAGQPPQQVPDALQPTPPPYGPQVPSASPYPGAPTGQQPVHSPAAAPYPQQGAPGQYAQQQPAQASQPGQQQPFSVPAGAPVPRKGLPVGAWIGIGAGAFVFVLLIAVGLVWFILAQTPSAEPIAPAPTTAPQVEPDTGTDRGASGERVSLDDPSNFSAGPFWGVPMESGWDIVRFDEQGVNEFKNSTAGCQFLTYQGFGPEGLTSADDRGATAETIGTAIQIGIPWNSTSMDFELVEDGTQDVEVDWAYPVEMQRYIAKYPSAEGERQRQMLLRVFMPSNIAMYAEVDCPASPAGDEAAKKVLDGLSLSEF